MSASAGQHRVRLRYVSESGSAWEDTVDPWAVVVRHTRWYLLCHSHRAAAIRTYRIDRVREVVALEDQEPVLEAHQVEEVDDQPGHPGEEAAELDALDVRDGGGAADGGQVALVAVPERWRGAAL